MKRAEETLSALMPALELNSIATWEPAEVELLCAMVKEYGRQARKGTAGEPDSLSSASEADEEDAGDEEPVEYEVDNIGEVDRKLGLIREFLKSRLPFGAHVEPTAVPNSKATSEAAAPASKKRARSPESATAAKAGANGALVRTPVYAVDAFLYDEEDIEHLVEQRLLSREYCTHCGSTAVGLTDFITHSLSPEQLVYMSCFLFPHLLHPLITARAAAGETDSADASKERRQQQLSIVDVGSRLGVVLWACAFAMQHKALLHPPADEDDADEEHEEGEDEEEEEENESADDPEVQLIGVELDSAYIKLSAEVVRRFFVPRRRHAPRLNGNTAPSAPVVSVEDLKDVSSQIHLVESDCFAGAGAQALQHATVVVLHNVFEYFCASPVEHARCWLKLRRLVCQSGQLLVCSPAVEETIHHFSKTVWAAACAAEGVEVSASPAAWWGSYAKRVDVAAIVSQYMERRQFVREWEQHEHQHHVADGSDAGESEDHHGPPDDEVEEQVQRIFVYRVL